MRHLFGVVVATIALTGCTKSSSVSVGGSEKSDEIFSNRPIAPRPQVVTAHLASPALLKVGRKTPSGWVIPESSKRQLLQGPFQAEGDHEGPAEDQR
jgi:hypothetical protein